MQKWSPPLALPEPFGNLTKGESLALRRVDWHVVTFFTAVLDKVALAGSEKVHAEQLLRDLRDFRGLRDRFGKFLLFVQPIFHSHAEAEVFLGVAQWELAVTKTEACGLEESGGPDKTLLREQGEVFNSIVGAKPTRLTEDIDIGFHVCKSIPSFHFEFFNVAVSDQALRSLQPSFRHRDSCSCYRSLLLLCESVVTKRPYNSKVSTF